MEIILKKGNFSRLIFAVGMRVEVYIDFTPLMLRRLLPALMDSLHRNPAKKKALLKRSVETLYKFCNSEMLYLKSMLKHICLIC